MDSQFIWNALLTIGIAVVGALAGLGAKYITQMQENQDTKIKQMREDHRTDFCSISSKVDSTQEDLGDFKVFVQREFVNREEYIRTTQSLDAKMDRVLGEIGKIQVNIAKLAAAQEVK